MKELIIAEYCNEADKTFISKEIWNNDDLISIECVGWYFGEPNEKATIEFTGKLKAEYK